MGFTGARRAMRGKQDGLIPGWYCNPALKCILNGLPCIFAKLSALIRRKTIRKFNGFYQLFSSIEDFAVTARDVEGKGRSGSFQSRLLFLNRPFTPRIKIMSSYGRHSL